jgi:hypothetical protein
VKFLPGPGDLGGGGFLRHVGTRGGGGSYNGGTVPVNESGFNSDHGYPSIVTM